MRGLLWMLAAGIVLAATPAWGAGISVTVDRTSANVDEQLVLTVTVEGSQSAEPNLPDLHDFEVQGRGKSTQMQFVNGNLSTAATYSFVLTPKHQGSITIASATVDIDGQSYKSDPFSVTINAAARGPANQGDQPLFITGEVSTQTPYVGQQVVYTWRFYRRAVRVANASVSLPTFSGFATETLGQQREFDTTVKGQRFSVTEIRVALFPQDVGKMVLPGSSLQCDIFITEGGRSGDPFNSPFGAFFGGGGRQQNRTLRSPPVNLDVRPLPAPVPPTFHDLIGEFRIDANVQPSRMHVGESTTLTVSVSGSGNVQRISEPVWSSLEKFKVYDDKPVSQTAKGGDTLQGSKVFRKALVPTEAGILRIEPIAITYFNADEQVYKTVSTQPMVLSVEPGAGGEIRAGAPAAGLPPSPAKTDVQVLGDDLLPQVTRLTILDEHRFGPWSQGGLAVGFFLPPLAFLLFALRQRQQSVAGEAHYVAAQRRRTALRKAMKTRTEVQDRTGGGQHLVAAQTASRGLRTYLGDKCHAEGMALTAADARDMVLRFGGDQALADEVERYLTHCEAAQYGVAQGTVMLYTNLAGELETLLKKLDRALKV